MRLAMAGGNAVRSLSGMLSLCSKWQLNSCCEEERKRRGGEDKMCC